MTRSIILGSFLTGFWALLSGHYSIDHVQIAVLGGLSVVGVLLISLRMNIVDRESVPVRIFARSGSYLPWLLKAVVTSNLDVVWRVWKKDIPISPKLIKVPASQKTELGWVIYANSITLTPGTISLRVRHNVILVHALTSEGADELREGEMDRRVSDLEGV